MNKDTLIGFALIALVLIGFSWWNQPSAEQIEAARMQDSIAAVAKEKAEKAAKEAAELLTQQPKPTPQPCSIRLSAVLPRRSY